MGPRIASFFLLAVGLFALPASGQNDIYDNGPTNGNVNGWLINFGFTVEDSFHLTSASTVNGVNFAAWMFPGDVLESVEVTITSSEFGGVTYFDQQVNFTQGSCSTNEYSYAICNEVGTFSGINLNTGTYWMMLQNGVTAEGNPVGWDMNSGPSMAYAGGFGTIPSESFTILGSASSGTGTTPEPGNILLLGSGLVGVSALLRRRLF